MIYISKIIIPLITVIIIGYGIYRKIDIYDVFLEGVKEGLEMALSIFPSMFAMVVAVSILVKSGLLTDFVSLFKIRLFPKEILPIAVLRPISGSSSLMLLNDLLKVYGPDSVIGKIASVIAGATDTTIYIIGLYFSSIKIKKIRYALVVGLLADLACIIISIIIVK